jgi:RecB family exonuclease
MARVSALKLRVFSTCRLRYRYQYLDKVPARLRPGDTAGSLVHRVLCDFYSKLTKGERTKDRLLELFEEGWTALSPRYLRMPGVDALYEAAVGELALFAQRFDLQAEPFLVEPYFQVDISPGVTLFGRMDRIDEERDGTLQIIDYKTGESPEDVDAGQLRVYAIIVEAKLRRTVSKASFWYLDDGTVWTTDLSAEDKQQALAELLATAHDMQTTTDFTATIAPHCAACPYLHACEHRDEIAFRREAEGW